MSQGTLFVIATPIGNLGDITGRAVETLKAVEVIACEDTRTTRTLLARYGIEARTVAVHEHNERAACAGLLELLRSGKSVALVSDAGTPGVSDPGARVVEAAHRAGFRVSPLPGPSAAAAAVSVSGFAGERWLFAGFLPASRSARRRALVELEMPSPVVLYEAPHRIAETLEDLCERFGAEREVLIARELTKKFEQVVRVTLGKALAWLAEDANRQQGEFVLVLAAGAPREADVAQAEKILRVLLEALPPSEAARLAARITGLPKGALYRSALAMAK
jgi:16S rRNA (cytidine1402-2'-O)-methyltransferase